MTYTKKCRLLTALFWSLGFGVSVLPFLVYAVIGFVDAGTTEKLVLTLGAVAAAVIGLTNFFFKKHLRSPLWILLLVLYIVLDEITPLLICAAVGCVLDELLFTPLCAHFRSKTLINSELDKRHTV